MENEIGCKSFKLQLICVDCDRETNVKDRATMQQHNKAICGYPMWSDLQRAAMRFKFHT